MSECTSFDNMLTEIGGGKYNDSWIWVCTDKW